MDLGDKNKDDIKEPTFKETCDMLKELKNREGVTAIETGPYSKFTVTVDKYDPPNLEGRSTKRCSRQ